VLARVPNAGRLPKRVGGGERDHDVARRDRRIAAVGGDPLLTGLVAFAIPAALVGGLLRLVRERGVTVHAVAGSLAIYLLVGLLFAWVVDVVAAVQSTPYFAQGSSGTEGQRVYFSFTVLTTTGFGDLTAATPVGRALAVLEMLIGQLYLVTVIGLVVTNFRGRGRRPTG
jgi:hypothetical protein